MSTPTKTNPYRSPEIKSQADDEPVGADKTPPATTGAYMALAAALLGWLFDGAEMGIFSYVGKHAITDLMRDYLATLPKTAEESIATGLPTPDAAVGYWFGVIIACFLVGAATGGVVFGWLGDRIGRVRAMTLSVVTYAVFTGLCFFATEAWHIGVLRFIAALGMGGEWSLGVALVMEVWPNRSRAYMAGLIGAAANVGYMLVGFVGLVLVGWLASLHDGLISAGMKEETATWLTQFNGWRIIMLLGTLPALLTFFIRIFVPESKKWQHENEKGATSNWQTADLVAVLIGLVGPGLIIFVWSTTALNGLGAAGRLSVQVIVTVVGLAIATVGYLYPVIRYFQRSALQSGKSVGASFAIRRMLLAACLSGVALLGTWGSTQWAPSFADQKVKAQEAAALKIAETADGSTPSFADWRPREWTLIWISFGAVVGTLLAAAMGDLLGRRIAYFILCILSLASIYIFYLGGFGYGPVFLFWAFIAGTFTASFYGWLPLYLPELFTTNVRATGQGFGFNFGRILAAIGVLQTGNLMGLFKTDLELGGFTIPHGYPLACSTMSLIYLVGMVIIWFAPETKGKPLPE